MSRPVFPDEITLKLTGKDYTLNVLNSLVLEGRTVELAKEEINHRFIPINWKQIDMKAVLSNWLDVMMIFKCCLCHISMKPALGLFIMLKAISFCIQLN